MKYIKAHFCKKGEEKWADRRALLIQGARRIGKSTIVEEFARKEYRSYILINFQTDLSKVEDLFKNDISDMDSFFRNLSLMYGVKLFARESLIVFDEVQLFPVDRLSTSLILDAVPSELSSKSRLFRTTTLGRNAKTSRKYSSYEAIKDSMIVNIAYNCTDPSVGLKLNKDYSKQKIYMADTGLLITQIFADSDQPIDESIYRQLITGKLGVNMGMIMENAVAAALRMKGQELYFHRFERYEIDFLCVDQKKLLPLEVKASSYNSHKSLDKFTEKFSGRVKTSYLIYGKDLKKEGNLLFVPFYMAGLI